MINVSIKKLFRRCLLIALIGVATGCASVKQMPSILPPVEDHSTVVKAVNKEVVAETKTASAEPIQPIAREISDKDFALESPAPENKLLTEISSRFNLPIPVADEIITLATKNEYEDFPKRNDILAIVAVESSYKAKALLQGCYGLMQVQKKSHIQRLAGRNLFNPSVNIELGSSILNQYYLLLNKDKRAAILAYNAGIGNYLKHRYKQVYYEKYLKQLKLLPMM